MTIAIMQPGYLPWLGFFELMWQSDIFIVYDNVQYDKNGWRNRNRIKTANGPQWLTVPVKTSISLKVNEVLIDNSRNWQRKHLVALKTNYGRTEYFNQYWPIFEKVLTQKWEKLIDLDMVFIYEINKILGLEKEIKFSSHIEIQGERVGRLIDICKHLGADTFYEAAGGKNYLEEEIERFNQTGIKLKFQQYCHPVYRQSFGNFIPQLSIIDLLFNEGDKSLNILINKN